MTKWFEVDKEGLAKLLERKGGKKFAVFELIQNAWDEKSTQVDVVLTPVKNCPQAYLRVEDDSPEGFADISHAFTLFAESTKKSDPTKRGRFNLGEKLVLACCINAIISTTKGTVRFEGSKRRHLRTKRSVGSVFEGCIRMTHAECKEIERNIHQLIPPSHIQTTFNGVVLKGRNPIAQFNVPLATEKSDGDGVLRRTVRQTIISVYEPHEGKTAYLYEMGIPVVETGDRYHVDIAQKIPLNMDRDNVPPAYLRDVRTFVLNHTYDRLHAEEVKASWVRDATADENVEPDVVRHVVVERFGEKSVAFDPTDLEANKLAVSRGYTVVPGGSMSAGEWSNIRDAGVVRPAGQVTPSPKPFSDDGKPLSLMDRSKWSPKMFEIEKYIQQIAKILDIGQVTVLVTNEVSWPFKGCYGNRTLTINRGRQGKKFFEDFPLNRIDITQFLIHEYGHEYEKDHLSSDYHESLCRIGAELIEVALNDPEELEIRSKKTV